ncbi:MAG: GNAT family N-acetyltransferase [Methylobacterium sp.]|nr:GNAT family N-acetyltransferase [Methylobacterium sp.]MCA3638247.1 GNAT family N-acetyltransferase [Methylobacterium sp.]
MTSPRLTVEILPGLAGVAATEWDALSQGPAGNGNPPALNDLATNPDSSPETGARPPQAPESSPEEEDDSAPEVAESPSEEDEANPFLTHAFLLALEQSGSVGGRTGWTPLHLLARDERGRATGALPAYAKSHSRGEYVFDHAFAEAYTRAGERYYPKLQVCVPFTPATGRRLLVPAGPEAEAIRAGLVAGLEGLRQRIDASSLHATFLTHRDRDTFLGQGFLERNDQQFHFEAAGYRDFQDFLENLASRKRKVLKRERRDALANGITVEWLTGSDLREAHWDAFFDFYMETGSRKWGTPYLARAFFSEIGQAMPEKILLIMAKRAGRSIAGALNFIGGNTLYGRNWGAIEHHPFLHFELCYYQAIDFALSRGLTRVEAGAQGEHKLARGYRPVKTISVHRFADPRFQRAVADYLVRERAHVDAMQEELETLTPFRNP